MIRTLALIALLTASAFAADVDGKWAGSMTGRDGNTREVSFTFKAEGNKLTGTMLGPMGNETAISDGKIDGSDLSFKVSLEFGGNAITLNYSGKLDGSELHMKSTREGAQRTTEFTLKKAGS